MRLLKTLVIAMGVLMVVTFGALVFIVMNRVTKPASPPVATSAPQPLPATEPRADPLPALPGQSLPQHFTPNFGEQTLVLPAGARVSDFSAGGERLVLRLILPDQSQQLVVVDLNTGALIGTLKLDHEASAAPSTVLPPLPGVSVPPRNRQEGSR